MSLCLALLDNKPGSSLYRTHSRWAGQQELTMKKGHALVLSQATTINQDQQPGKISYRFQAFLSTARPSFASAFIPIRSAQSWGLCFWRDHLQSVWFAAISRIVWSRSHQLKPTLTFQPTLFLQKSVNPYSTCQAALGIGRLWRESDTSRWHSEWIYTCLKTTSRVSIYCASKIPKPRSRVVSMAIVILSTAAGESTRCHCYVERSLSWMNSKSATFTWYNGHHSNMTVAFLVKFWQLNIWSA